MSALVHQIHAMASCRWDGDTGSIIGGCGMQIKDIAPWVAAIALGLGNMGQLVDRAVTENKLQGSAQFGDSLLVTIGDFARTCESTTITLPD